MASGFVIRKNQYYDSVFLMGINKRFSDAPGVLQSAVLMAGEANKGLLSSIGVNDPQITQAQANDLIAAVVADTPQIVNEVLGNLDEYLQGGVQASSTSYPHSLQEALNLKPDANLAVISVPGEYAGSEARKALEAGLNVFIFSSNVSSQDELALKQYAAQRNLLVMGPDCGTSLINNIGLGFTNVVRRGPVGAIGAAGTGLQEFTSQVHNAGSGISHAIGIGSHDLSDQIGGLTAFAALDALERDAQTRVIVVISKPPGTRTLSRLMERFKVSSKPIIGCFLGAQNEIQKSNHKNFRPAFTIDEAVQLALGKSSKAPSPDKVTPAVKLEEMPLQELNRSKEQKYLRGLFAGGTLCYQSQQILQEADIPVYSNAPLYSKYKLVDASHSHEHTVVDMGAEEYTLGKPHPMIDGSLRKQRILAEARDPQTAILLLDFILGYNASMDPVGELLDALIEAKQSAEKANRNLTIVASVCGTQEDPQDMDLQIKMLNQAGVIVFRSNAEAVRKCIALLKKSGGSIGITDR